MDLNTEMSTQESEKEDISVSSVNHDALKGKSWIWSHFHNKQIKKNKETFVGKACNYCPKVYDLRKGGGSTTTLQNHILNHHKEKIPKLDNPSDEANKGAITNYFQPFSPKEYSKLEMKKALIEWIVTSDQPFLEVENESFRKFCLTLNPHAEMPTRNTLRNWIFEEYEERQKELIKILNETDSKISITLDCWTSPSQLPFLCITAHFITQKWKKTNVVLDFVSVEGSHSGENLAEALKLTLAKFGINGNKILAIVTDNASNNETMLKELAKTIETFSPDEHRVRCIAHIIHLSVTSFLSGLNATPFDCEDEIDSAVSGTVNKLRKLCVKVRSSPLRRQKFRTACKSSGNDELMLILDVKTRWNSTFEMVERGIKLKEAIGILTSWEPDLAQFALNETDWNILKNIEEFLKIFRDATTHLCGEKYATIQFVIPVYNYLLENMTEFRKSKIGDDQMTNAIDLAYQKISNYYDLTGQDTPLSEVYGNAILLDPTLKTSFFKEKNWTSGCTKAVREKAKQCFANSYEKDETESNVGVDLPTNVTSLVAQLYKKRKMDKRNELDQYLATAAVPFESNGIHCDRIAWWQANEFQFPGLSKMARDYLAIPATSTPSERAFSSAKHFIGIRYPLSSETISKCMCLKEWFKSKMFD